MLEKDQLTGIIQSYLAGQIEVDRAVALAAALGAPKQMAAAVREVLTQFGEPHALPPTEHIGVIRVLRAAAGPEPDANLAADMQFITLQALTADSRFDEARALLPALESALTRRGDRRALAGLKHTQASLAFQAGRISDALAAWHTAERELQVLDDERNVAGTRAGLGKAYAQLGQREKARGYLTSAIEVFAGLGLRLEEFHALLDLADTYSEDSVEQRLRTLSRAAALARHGPIHAESRLQVLGTLCSVALRSGALQEGAEAAEQGMRLCRELGRRDAECIFLGNLGSALADLGRFEEALARFEETKALAEVLGDAEGVQIAEKNIAIAQNRARQVPPSKRPEPRWRSAARRVVQHISEIGSKDPLSQTPKETVSSSATEAAVLEVLVAAAQKHLEGNESNDPLQQLPLPQTVKDPDRLAQLLQERIDSLEKENPRLAFLLMQMFAAWMADRLSPERAVGIFSNLAGYCMRASEMGVAANLFERASQVALEAKLIPQFVVTKTNLGTVLRQSGRPLDAIAAYEEAKNASDDEDSRCSVLVNLATAFSDLGLHQEALLASSEAVAILQSQEPSLGLIIALVNSAASAYALGNLDVAEKQTMDALDLSRRLDIPTQEGVALGHIGLIRLRKGNSGSGLQLIQRAAEIAEAHNDFWNAQHWRRDLANAYAWTGAKEAAHAAYAVACDLSRRVRDVRSEALTKLGLALTVDSRAEAKPFLDEAWRLAIETHNVLVAAQVAEGAARALAGSAVEDDFLDEAVLRAVLKARAPNVTDPIALSEAREWLERGKELAAMSGGSAAVGLDLTEAQILALEGKVDRAIELLKVQVTRKDAIADASRDALLGRLYVAIGQPGPALDHLEAAIAGLSRSRAELRSQSHRLAMSNGFSHLVSVAIECALSIDDPNRAFAVLERSKVEEIKRRRLAVEGPVQSPSLSELAEKLKQSRTAAVFLHVGMRGGHAFLATPTGTASINLELDIVTVGNQWTTLGTSYAAARDPAAAFEPEREARWRATLGSLLADLGSRLRPLLGRIEQEPGVERLILVPQGLLHAFPLHAVPLSDGKALIERFEVAYALSAAAALTELPEARESATRFGVADSLGDLPCSRHELSAARPTTSLVGSQVTSARLLEIISMADWLHVACHARQALADEDATGIYIAPGEQADLLSLGEITRQAAVRAGAVIVLSCCETSASTPALADEYSSISGAFIGAGARAVVASLWRADDVATLLLMQRLYQRLAEGSTLEASLSYSQAWLRTLTETEAATALETALPDSELRARFGKRFSARRTDARPFQDPASWASFQLLQA